MEIKDFFKSIIDSDSNPIVICDVEHTVIYLNLAAIYKYGKDILGKSILSCHNARSNEMIIKIVEWFKKDENNNKVHTFYSEKYNKDAYMIALRDDLGNLIGYYEKHEVRTKDDAPFYQTV